MKNVTLQVIKNILLSTRMKTFYWSTGMMILAVIINQLIILISSQGLTTPIWVLLGLILAQISKGIRNVLSEDKPLSV